MRNPYFTVCGVQYTLSILYGYIASIVMLLLAKSNAKTPGMESTVNDCIRFGTIFGAVSLSLFILLIRFFMVKKYHSLFWSRLNPARHFSEFIWSNNMYAEWGTSLDDHRAYAITKTFIPRYWKHDPQVRAWLHEKWPSWQMDAPWWFGEAFITTIPASLVPSMQSRVGNFHSRDGHSSSVVPET